MAYYRLSQVLKMRREAMEQSRFDYDAEGPSFMTVFRLEKGEVRVKEKTYRNLSRAMGEEESTRRGVLKTTDIRVLRMVNEIANAFLHREYDKVEELLEQLETKLDCSVKRNQQYLEFTKAKLQYYKGLLSEEEYETIAKRNISYGTMNFDGMITKEWPFHEQEWQMLLGIEGLIRSRQDYEQQKYLLEQMMTALEREYLEAEYNVAYTIYVRWRISDVLGNLGYYREAIAMDEETIQICENRNERRYLAELHYSIFWCYYMLKKKETLTKQEESRCKECLLKAYYINKAWYRPKELYEKRMRECYPEELM
ncbi:MAG: hypothetical protein J6K04_00070 [Lachnospiraceae bacterium]|nr:hypothetical protein [Lachnospiraceae bacterium]